jgi:general secretion pathway protein M
MSTIRERLDKLEPRERRLLSALGAVFAGLVILILPITIVSSVSSKRAENDELRDLISRIYESRNQVADRKAQKDAILARYAKPAPALAGFIEDAARTHGLQVPESQDRPEAPHGKRYTERMTVVKMHKIGMLALAKTLEKIERSGHPVAVTKLSIRPRSGEPDSFEVELGVSAFDRKPDASPAPSSSAAPSAPVPVEPGGTEL